MTTEQICKNLIFHKWESISATIQSSTPVDMEINEFFDDIRKDPKIDENGKYYYDDGLPAYQINNAVNGKTANDFLTPCMVFFDIDFHFDNELDRVEELKRFYKDTNTTTLQEFVDKLKNDPHIISAGLSKSGVGIRGFACVWTRFYEESLIYDLSYPTDWNKQIHRSNWNYLMDYLSTNYGINRTSIYANKDTSAGKLSQLTFNYRLTGSFYKEDWLPLENFLCEIKTESKYEMTPEVETIETAFLNQLLEKNLGKFQEILEHYDGFYSISYMLRHQSDEVIMWWYNVINKFYSLEGGFRKNGHLKSFDSFKKEMTKNQSGEDLPMRVFLFKRGIYYDDPIEIEECVENEYYVSEVKKAELLPKFSDDIYKKFPQILQDLCFGIDGEKRDFLLMSILATCSIYFCEVKTNYYEGTIIYPNIFFFGTSSQSSGKSIVRKAKILTRRLEREQRELYRQKKDLWREIPEKQKKGKESPKEVKWVIGGDGGRASLIKYLMNNNGKVLFWDTEAETLAANSKSDWGDMSMLIRSGIMNEPIDKNRAGEDSMYIECPKIAASTTGTLDQIMKVVGQNGIQNGTYARLLIYWWYNELTILEDPHSNTDNSIFEYYGDKLYEFWDKNIHTRKDEIVFDYTDLQKRKFYEMITKIWYSAIANHGKMADTISKKFFNFSKKICMILTMLRMIEGKSKAEFNLFSMERNNYERLEISDKIYPTDDDMYASIDMIRVLLTHSLTILRTINKEIEELEPITDWRVELFDNLPDIFSRKEAYAKITNPKGYNKSRKTAQRIVDGWINGGKIKELPEKNTFIKI